MPSTFSFGLLFTMLVILGASGYVFYILTLQWTTFRPLQALSEWAADRRFRLELPPFNVLPVSLQGLHSIDPRMETMLVRGPVSLVRLTTAGKPTGARPVWNLIIRQIPSAQNPAGLRPASATTSFLDLFSLTGFPSILSPERFIVVATDSRDARQLVASSARGLLPADIGLLIHGPYVTLDFSSRPFDPIEFDRMLVILDQITQKNL